MQCPRCDGTLHQRALGPTQVHVCDGCRGTLVRQPDLVDAMEAMAATTLKLVDPNDPIEAMPDPGVHLACPLCRREMEAFRYLGSEAVIADRCHHDEVVWTDVGELGTMSLLFARTSERLKQATDAQRRERDQIKKDLALPRTSRATANRIATAMLTGPAHTAAGYGSFSQFFQLLFGGGDEEDEEDEGSGPPPSS